MVRCDAQILLFAMPLAALSSTPGAATAPAGRAVPDSFEDNTMPATHPSRTLYRIDECPDLPFPAGQLLRLGSADFRRYSAAVRTFGEVVFPVAQPDLAHWPQNYILGS